MKFLPYENYTITTRLSPQEIYKRMEGQVEPKAPYALFGGYQYTKPYYGKVWTDNFEMTRNINYRNSFLPTVRGTLSQEFGRTKVHITMQMFPFVILFMCIWVGAALFGAIMICYATLTSPDNHLLALLPFVMPLAGYLLCTLPFKYESRKTKAFLAEVLMEEKEMVV